MVMAQCAITMKLINLAATAISYCPLLIFAVCSYFLMADFVNFRDNESDDSDIEEVEEASGGEDGEEASGGEEAESTEEEEEEKQSVSDESENEFVAPSQDEFFAPNQDEDEENDKEEDSDRDYNGFCNLCPRTFENIRGVSSHVTVQKNEAQFCCPAEDCCRRFKNKSDMCRHASNRHNMKLR